MRYWGLLLILLASGCGAKSPPAKSPVGTEPRVSLVQPTVRDLKRIVGQPSFIDSYEQTAIYAKLPAYVLKWNVDIGDRVTKNQLLATLFIPELAEELTLKTAEVAMSTALVRQAEKLVEVAQGNLTAAEAQVAEAKANVGKFAALVERWKSETQREQKLVEEDVLDRQVLDESTRQLQSSEASNDAALAAVQTADADRLARQADLEKSKVDVDVARAKLDVATADEKRVQALFGYTKLMSPFDGIVVLRNVNTGDFVLPATGDPSAAERSSDQSAAKAAPLYVVARTDVVRVYVDVPEEDANFVVSRVDVDSGDKRPVTKATVLVPSYQAADLPAEVTRSAWALNFKSRTLRTEIDLRDPQAHLLPGMYAYGNVTFERKGATVLPRAVIGESGNQAFCYLYANGKALQTPVELGMRADDWVEVLKKNVDGTWHDFDGQEQVILGDMSEIISGQAVLAQSPSTAPAGQLRRELGQHESTLTGDHGQHAPK
ncbi:MAG: efflux RND transporter periplasmic adaptor subunit [Pirellulales bacterium]